MSNEKLLCEICGDGSLQLQVRAEKAEYKGQERFLSLEYSICSSCGSEQANAAQLRNNKRAMMAFKKEVDGLLPGKKVKELREHFRITQGEAARLFGGGPVAFSKYEADDVAQSESMDKLLRVSLAVPNAFIWLARQAGELAVCNRELQRNMRLMENFRHRDYRSDIFKEVSESCTVFQGSSENVVIPANDEYVLEEAFG